MSEINAKVALGMLTDRIREEGKIVGRLSWEGDGMCSSGCSLSTASGASTGPTGNRTCCAVRTRPYKRPSSTTSAAQERV